MKLVEFTYIKTDGSTSQRAVVELVQPTQFFEGIDVSHMGHDELAEFCSEFGAMKAAQHEQTLSLLNQFDLKHNYRRFIPEKMASVQTDYV